MIAAPIDLLVLGGGMAGLAAAARAAQAGASVVVVEKAPRPGGSAVYAGFIWTAPTLNVMREINPGGDELLASRLVDGYPTAIDWVRSLGVEVGTPVSVLGYGRGSQTDMPQLLATCERIVRQTSGCEILLGTRTHSLLVHDGRVCGAEVVSASGEHREINARHTLLATGGFGGDPSLRERHLHRLARDLPLRANPYSTGDGLRPGLEAGAAFGKRDAGFYVHDDWMLRPYVEGVEPIDAFRPAYRRGARCAVAEDLEEFGYLPEEWGYPGPLVRGALEQFNAACAGGHPEPPRARDAAPLVDPPYYVTEVVPAITFTFGGVLIDSRARALDALGAPVPGLLAAGADAGGLWYRAYAGGVATALVFGLQAAETALAGSPASPTLRRAGIS